MGNVDAGNVSASNTCLFKGVKPPRIQAEEALYQAQNGDYSQTFDSMNPETYTAMSELVANGDVKGVKDMTDLYNKAYNNATKSNDKTKIKANAMISGQVNFTDQEKTDFCIELMHSIDNNRGRGGSTNVSAGYTNSADYQTEQLKAILQNNPQIMDAVKTRVEKEDFSYTTTTSTFNGPGQQPTTTTSTKDTKNSYLQLLKDTKNIVQEEVFYDENGKRITDPAQINAIKTANMQSLEQMRQYVAELERDYKKGIDAEGTLSDMANGLSKYSGIGTDREDVATEYRNAKLMLQQFEAAAQGRLRDSDGNVISSQDLAQQMLDKQNALAETNSDYKQTIAYGKMGIIMAPVIVATTVASGGLALGAEAALATGATTTAAVLGSTYTTAAVSGIVAGATTYGLNSLEYNTSYTGNTAEAREQNLQDSLVNGATTAIGIGQMKYIGNMANNMGTAARTGIRLTATIAADTGVGAATEGITTGDVSTSGLVSNMVMSGVGNAIGAKSLGKKQPTGHLTHETPTKVHNEIADAEIAKNIDKSHLNANQRKMVENAIDAQGTPTQAELNAYAKENGYKAPTAEEKATIDANNAKAAQANAEAHKIENNATITEQKPKAAPKEAIDKLQDEIKGLDGSISNLNKRIAGAKKFGKNTEALEQQLAKLQEQRALKNAELKKMQTPAEAPTEGVKVKPDEVKLENTFKPVKTEEEAKALFSKQIDDRFGASSLKNGNNTNAIFEATGGNGTVWSRIRYADKNFKQGTQWKMHIYADSPQEWANAAQVAMPYLEKNKMVFKTMGDLDTQLTKLSNDPVQKGKAFTVYFESEDAFLQAAKDLEVRFKESGLKSSGTVANEAQIGDSGFLSYRHEGAERGKGYKPEGVEDPYVKKFGSSSKQNVAQEAPINQIHQPTPQERMEMVQISNDINKAKTPKDIAKAKASLDKIPDCQQKSLLLTQLEQKAQTINPQHNNSYFDEPAHVVTGEESANVKSQHNNSYFDEPAPVVTGEKAANVKSQHNNSYFDEPAPVVTGEKAANVKPQHNNSHFMDATPSSGQVFGKDVKLQRGARQKISSGDSIRLGDQVDIDFNDFKAKFNSMKNGDSFIIGREATGVNDIRINNEFVSGQHLKVEKINGEIYITDLSSNGTTLNSTKPDYAAKYSPNLQQKFASANYGHFKNMIDENYNNLRRANYTLEESISGNITDADLFDTSRANIYNAGGWNFRTPKGHNPVDASRVADRISLNVTADNNLLAELDRLCATGTYVNSNGQTVRVNMPDCTYKTPQSLQQYTTRHDPITMYFECEVPEDVQNAIADIAGKYARQSSNGKSLMNSLEGKPYIAHEAYTSPRDAQNLWYEAQELNPSLADAIHQELNSDGDWNCSTGQFAACKKLIDEYKLSIAII